MKLFELKQFRKSTQSETVTVEPAGGIYGEIDLNVAYTYEGASSTQHEPDNSSFREYHAPEIDIESIKLAEPVKEYDEDGELTGKVWAIGFDATKLPEWVARDNESVMDALVDKLEKTEPDFNEPD